MVSGVVDLHEVAKRKAADVAGAQRVRVSVRGHSDRRRHHVADLHGCIGDRDAGDHRGGFVNSVDLAGDGAGGDGVACQVIDPGARLVQAQGAIPRAGVDDHGVADVIAAVGDAGYRGADKAAVSQSEVSGIYASNSFAEGGRKADAGGIRGVTGGAGDGDGGFDGVICNGGRIGDQAGIAYSIRRCAGNDCAGHWPLRRRSDGNRVGSSAAGQKALCATGDGDIRGDQSGNGFREGDGEGDRRLVRHRSRR